MVDINAEYRILSVLLHHGGVIAGFILGCGHGFDLNWCGSKKPMVRYSGPVKPPDNNSLGSLLFYFPAGTMRNDGGTG